MKANKSPLPGLLLLLPLAACEPVSPTEPPAPMQAMDAAALPITSADATTADAPAANDSAATAAPASEAGPARDAATPDAAPADASAADAASGGDAQAPDAGLGCLRPCPLGAPCPELPDLALVAPQRCGPPPPPTPPATCTSGTGAITGYCGSYACKMTTASFASAFNPAGHCANARDFMCAGTIHALAYQCMINNLLVVKSAEATATCLKSDPGVAASHGGDACVNCFVTATECCKKNEQCMTACVQGAGKACDDAQRAAGCTGALVTCTGMPNTF